MFSGISVGRVPISTLSQGAIHLTSRIRSYRRVMSHHDHDHPLGPPSLIDRRTLLRVGGIGFGALLLAACAPKTMTSTTGTASPSTAGAPSSLSATSLPGFAEFAATVTTTLADGLWMIESDGMPEHEMMTGITSWQQQVPVPQPYTGANAWRFPSQPQLADQPISARTSLYRGAIALAVNGVPIFNALNNRGDDAFLAGELDSWGGHSGRADDYHYHVAPLHLSERVGAGKPIAYALDGFPIYGITEPDGSNVTGLDELNGHDIGSGYHYHGTTTYPYINGGLRGVVNVAGDQIDPQPMTRPFRPDGQPLRGATITSFTSSATGKYVLTYSLDGGAGHVDYALSGSTITFTYIEPSGATRHETYTR